MDDLTAEHIRAMYASDPAVVRGWIERGRTLRAALARRNVNAFIEFVGRDEESGAPILQAPLHMAFQHLALKHHQLVLHASIEAGKTVQLSVLRPLWLLGGNPNLRVAVVSNTQEQSVKITRTVKQYIERSDELHLTFPHLRAGKKWTDQAFVVDRSSYSKDYSFQALGVHGAVLGARIDELILDDVLDYENTRTATQREELWRWVHATLLGRLTRQGRVIAAGTAWHPEDLLHRLARKRGWASARFPIVHEETGKPYWPERWTPERIALTEERLGPLESARQLYLRARDDSTARFRREWIDRCLARGEGRELPLALSAVPKGYRIYTGVDLGTSDKASSDLTVLFTIAVHPNDDREVLCVESGQWTGPEIVARIVDTHHRFQSIIYVESNAAQAFVVQFTQAGSAIPVRSFTTTGKNKHDPAFGLESLGVELANGKWIIPSRGGTPASTELAEWISELLYYSPDTHTGDRAMASWICREAARAMVPTMETGRLDTATR